MKDVQCYELFGGIALKNHAFSIFFACLQYYSLITKINAYVVKVSQNTNKQHQIKKFT